MADIQTIRAEGKSMRPLIPPGSEIAILPRDGRMAAPGEIWLIRTEGRPVLHRIIARNRLQGETRFLEKGDLSPWVREVLAEGLLGKALHVQKEGGILDLQKAVCTLAGKLAALYFRILIHLSARRGERTGWRISGKIGWRVLHLPVRILNLLVRAILRRERRGP